ncbi:DUF6298 domain-containing protein [Mucilaginibacter sp. RS28]|uniref:DUF6298 domain-containing protein n=1 Tax=Mucilaginibacter straminoryzae TaxID=2932774 RepID=A0A9X2BBN0_9SPHI|nr:DUF6298 domain-containing protein [Mucilaginibacter straminoryzae]MCJ8210017.1 DUF6298 domain-containing protein [Mucilaginibacter straminoryzae]
MNFKFNIGVWGCLLAAAVLQPWVVAAQNNKKNNKPASPVLVQKDGKLVYTADEKGDRVPDYSYCGYMASEAPIPDAAVKVFVPVKPGDATVRIQAALDYVAGLPADKNGIKGAVLLGKGIYQVKGSLKIKSSGVVLRGSGMTESGTMLICAGTDRETLINVAGKNDLAAEADVKITDTYVPVNSISFHVVAAGSLKAGDHILVKRPSTAAWINLLGTETFGGGLSALGWKPGDHNITWDRVITKVDGNTITIDAPITTALDTAYGGGTIARYQWDGRINQVGVENLLLRSEYNKTNPKDEDHRWMAITIENASDAWVRQVAFEHFAGSAVYVLPTANRVTVEDCRSAMPVSEIGGQRRYTFWTMGGQTLFQRLYADNGYHDFAVGFCAPGPNAFVQCMAEHPHSYSGAIDSWASGVLFDVIYMDGQNLVYKNLEQDNQGGGWSAANSTFWNCSAARVDNYRPPGAQNWAFGTWAQFGGNGYWEESNASINPRSLFYAQLSNRLQKDIEKQAGILHISTEASSSPTAEQAAPLVIEARKPAFTLKDWIAGASARNPIPVSSNGVKTIDELGVKAPAASPRASALTVANGWLVRGSEVLQGRHYETPWWNGSIKPAYLEKTAKPDITRWVPGRTGTGLTDDLNEVANWMQKSNTIVLEHNYGLWYERRRDDHERIRRADGDVWPPFYELPFARSGQQSAYDGLSKYDLTQYNQWYWNRLKQFADLADERGLVLMHQNYFQHNIIEAGAHYTDFPWRTANNINNTGFPEPVNYAGDKRQFMAEQFYDVTNPARRKLHIAYINKCLDNFANNNGVIQTTSAEYTGPLSFMKFWVETVKNWEATHKKKQLIGLSATKDVQDGMLADAVLAGTIDVIDIRYWYYQANGNVYAPPGGQSLAPRQQERVFKPKATSAEQVYRAVREYRDRYPQKAVLYSADAYDKFGWAVLMAGGSLPVLPATTDKDLLKAVSGMKPVGPVAGANGQWLLSGRQGYVVYSNSGAEATLNLDANTTYQLKWINPADGKVYQTTSQKGNGNTTVKSSGNGAYVLWVSKS